ncbi:uncharacterized protein V1516DRAFT_670520 [Lipomyces oligophaga]|uniref:uncharacterized protein n=1 Tax=Lipomyces oligophaga TaxID=45792 RepID=UPI0034CF49A1
MTGHASRGFFRSAKMAVTGSKSFVRRLQASAAVNMTKQKEYRKQYLALRREGSDVYLRAIDPSAYFGSQKFLELYTDFCKNEGKLRPGEFKEISGTKDEIEAASQEELLRSSLKKGKANSAKKSKKEKGSVADMARPTFDALSEVIRAIETPREGKMLLSRIALLNYHRKLILNNRLTQLLQRRLFGMGYVHILRKSWERPSMSGLSFGQSPRFDILRIHAACPTEMSDRTLNLEKFGQILKYAHGISSVSINGFPPRTLMLALNLLVKTRQDSEDLSVNKINPYSYVVDAYLYELKKNWPYLPVDRYRQLASASNGEIINERYVVENYLDYVSVLDSFKYIVAHPDKVNVENIKYLNDELIPAFSEFNELQLKVLSTLAPESYKESIENARKFWEKGWSNFEHYLNFASSIKSKSDSADQAEENPTRVSYLDYSSPSAADGLSA